MWDSHTSSKSELSVACGPLVFAVLTHICGSSVVVTKTLKDYCSHVTQHGKLLFHWVGYYRHKLAACLCVRYQ